jgi:hypothetical protein
MRIPKQTSAPHILLYSEAFLIKLALRRSRLWRIDFLFGLELSCSFGCVVSILLSSMVLRVRSTQMRGLNIMVRDERILMCVKRWRLHYISAWATIFSFGATIFRRGDGQFPSLKRMADRSMLAGIMQEHIEATVCAGHGSPRRYPCSVSPVVLYLGRLALSLQYQSPCLKLIWFLFLCLDFVLFLVGESRNDGVWHFAWVDEPLCVYAWALNGK